MQSSKIELRVFVARISLRIGEFRLLLLVFHLFNLLCSILRQDVLLACMRTPGEMARILRRAALLLSSSHDYATQTVRWF